MIRIIDEPVFEMTQAEYRRLYDEYWALVDGPGLEITDQDFESWLRSAKGFPYTMQGRIKP